MGRFLRQILTHLLRRPDVRLTLASRQRDDAAALESLLGRRGNWEFVTWHEWTRASDMDVAWFPWNRVDVRPAMPLVVTIHDTAAFDCPRQGWRAWLDNERARRRLRDAAVRADRVMTVSDFSRNCIIRHLAVAPSSVDVVTEGVSLATLADTVATPARPAPYVLFVGADDARKNLRGLLEAWRRLGDSARELVVAGSNPAPSRGGNSDKGVCFLGELDDLTLAGLYRWCDLFVMPSHYEGFGLPLLEAMACGAPVAAARAASLPEVGGEVPIWFDPSDVDDIVRALREGMSDPERTQRMRVAGRQRAREFTWEKAAEQVAECLKRAALRA